MLDKRSQTEPSPLAPFVLVFATVERSVAFAVRFLALCGVLRRFAEFGGDGDFVDVFAQETLYLTELGLVVQAYECDGAAFGAGAGGSAYAVHVVFGVVGDIEIDDQIYIIYIYSA